jgi:hypothetical protein
MNENQVGIAVHLPSPHHSIPKAPRLFAHNRGHSREHYVASLTAPRAKHISRNCFVVRVEFSVSDFTNMVATVRTVARPGNRIAVNVQHYHVVCRREQLDWSLRGLSGVSLIRRGSRGWCHFSPTIPNLRQPTDNSPTHCSCGIVHGVARCSGILHLSIPVSMSVGQKEAQEATCR